MLLSFCFFDILFIRLLIFDSAVDVVTSLSQYVLA